MRWITWSGVDAYREVGMFVVRVGLGLMIMMHGWPKVAGGAAKWERVGAAMGALGVDFYPVFWGAAAAFTEFFGGFLILIGFATRPVAALIVFTLFVAAMAKLSGASLTNVMVAAHPIETALAFTALFFAGPGILSIDSRLKRG